MSAGMRTLQGQRVVLASASPRRQQILSDAGLQFEVVPSQFKETLTKASFATPYAYAVETAKQKALEVAHRMHQKDLGAPDVVIGADTIVVIDGLILEKPVDRQDAYDMLSRLNGREHSVVTGVAIVRCSSQDGRLDVDVAEFYEETAVKFSQLSDELLWDYIDSGEPMDKAGGYGIQARGAVLVERVRGDVLNVVGFPLNRFCRTVAELPGPARPASVPTADASENPGDVGAKGAGLHPAWSDGGHGPRSEAPGPPDADRDRTADTLPPFPTGLLDLIDGFKASKALFAACKLKVFDLLEDQGPLRAGDVAGKLDTSECVTGRLLDVCVALGLLEKTDRGYRNTELAGLHLLSRGEHSLLGLALHCDDHAWPRVARLEHTVRTGAPDAEGCSQDPEPWFSGATPGLARLTARQVATAFDLSRFRSACDLGGHMGALARELAREYPGLRVTVFGRPEAVERVGRGTEQVILVPGASPKDALPEADLYIAAGLLRGWPDDRARDLLSRVSGSCRHPGGGLLLLEVALDEDAREARPGLRRSLHRLLHPRGPERGLGHHRRLLERHGFMDVRVAHTGDVLDVVLATRAVP